MAVSFSEGGATYRYSVAGSEEVARRLASYPEALRARLKPAFDSLASDLLVRAAGNMRAVGLRARTGTLSSAMRGRTWSNKKGVGVRVGSGADVHYAPWLEFGLTPQIKESRSRRYFGNSAVLGRKPWGIRAHPYMTRTFLDSTPSVASAVEAAARQATDDFNSERS